MQKEQKEWIRAWCDDTNEKDLPRVLLIGDSITNGYQEKVRTLLQGVCYVDFIATSYALAALIPEGELSVDNIIPTPLDKRVSFAVAEAVIKAAKETGVCRKYI